MSSSSTSRARRVLLVDADFRTSQRLAELLAEDGFEVEVVRDGAAAIARLSRAPLPGTLITELSVALADGSAIARYGRSLDPALRVIVLTRHPHLLVPSSFGGAAPALLTKPLDYAQLLELLQEAAARSDSVPAAARAPSPRG